MKTSTLFLALVIFGILTSFGDDIPKRLNFDRYTAMLDKPPFAVASAAVMPAATPDFAKDLYVANAAKSSDGDMVTIASSTDKNFKKYLTTKGPVEGYSIANIEWSERVGETKVTISKDGQFATLTFNQALLSQSMPNVAAQMNPVQPPAPTPLPMPGNVNIPRVPNPAIPAPHVRGVIQRNPPKTNPQPAPSPNIGLPAED